MSILFHLLIALVVSIAYFTLQADFSIEMKKQKTLFILTACVFVATFAVAYICIKRKQGVTFGENDIREFDDDISLDGGDDNYANQLAQYQGQPSQMPQMPSMAPPPAPAPAVPVPVPGPSVPSMPSVPPLPVA